MTNDAEGHKQLSENEFISAVVAANRAEQKREIRKTISVGRLALTFHWQSRHNLWGRFGGGWQWKAGFQLGGGTLIVDVLIFSLRFDWRRKATGTL